MSSNYINEQRREYSLYVLRHRAIPHAADGLKAGGRRVLWTARDGKFYKCATLAGATMPIHPHASPEGSINTLAAPYGNNIPLFYGDGIFGTRLNPTAYGASRYTSVKVSTFTKDVMFRDIEIVPMIENYDSTLMEPKHFLPLVPIALLNPSEGIAVGFATNILPRDLESIITSQLQYLQGKKVEEMMPNFTPINGVAISWSEDKKGNIKWNFEGKVKTINSSTVTVTELPYGTVHEKFIEGLDKLIEDGSIVDYIDGSKDMISIEVKFHRGAVDELSNSEMLSRLNLTNSITENMNVIDFTGDRVWSTNYVELIGAFCDWRLKWYKTRYERLRDLLAADIQRYMDVLLAIKRNVGGMVKKINSRVELKDFLEEIGVVNLDYIADLPIYRFTEDERAKVEKKMEEANALLKEYKKVLSSDKERLMIYVNELKEVLRNYQKGSYDE